MLPFKVRITTAVADSLSLLVLQLIHDPAPHRAAAGISVGITRQIPHPPLRGDFAREIRPTTKISGRTRIHRRRVGDEFFVQVYQAPRPLVRTFRQRHINLGRFWFRFFFRPGCRRRQRLPLSPAISCKVGQDLFESFAAWTAATVPAR